MSSSPERGRRGVALAGLLLATAGCDAFNMTPTCAESVPGLQRVLAGVDRRADVDPVRLSAAVAVDTVVETARGYNRRECRARVTVGPVAAEVGYALRQSEGIRDWYDIEVTPRTPDVAAVAAAAQAAYAGG